MECSICFDRILPANCASTSCGHNFHYNCLCAWKERHITCPLCRHDISADPSAPPMPDDVAVRTCINELFDAFNFQRKVPASAELKEEFFKSHMEIIELWNQGTDPMTLHRMILQNEIKRYQLLRLNLKMKSDEAASNEAAADIMSQQLDAFRRHMARNVPQPSWWKKFCAQIPSMPRFNRNTNRVTPTSYTSFM